MMIIGTTSDGRRVVQGVFRFFETHGLPLDVLFDMLNERGLVPDWVSFFAEALAAGMKPARILAKLDEAVSDSYGREMRDVVVRWVSVVRKRHPWVADTRATTSGD